MMETIYTERKPEGKEAVGLALMSIGILIAALFWNAFVIYALWRMFIPDAFWPSMSYSAALGFRLLIVLAGYRRRQQVYKHGQEHLKVLFLDALVRPTFVLILGAVMAVFV